MDAGTAVAELGDAPLVEAEVQLDCSASWVARIS